MVISVVPRCTINPHTLRQWFQPPSMVSEHVGRSSIHAVFQGTVENRNKTLRCTLILKSFSGYCCCHNSRKLWEDALVTRSRSAVSEDVSRSSMDDGVSQGNCRKSTQEAPQYMNPVNGLGRRQSQLDGRWSVSRKLSKIYTRRSAVHESCQRSLKTSVAARWTMECLKETSSHQSA